ncbi:MAG: hypothetical protein KDA87_24130, partial [Planctomycetales bacterium]|nr:hypothetical protein [Planctomycetales bacterium]
CLHDRLGIRCSVSDYLDWQLVRLGEFADVARHACISNGRYRGSVRLETGMARSGVEAKRMRRMSRQLRKR